jgi:hypothetical protein
VSELTFRTSKKAIRAKEVLRIWENCLEDNLSENVTDAGKREL